MLKRKSTLQWTFLEVTMAIFKSESSIAALYSNLFKKLGQNEMKIETYILTFQTQKKNY
jgi:hypothetical protein